MEKLRVSLVQTDLVWESPAENWKNIGSQIQKLKNKTDLIILPEMFTTGFHMMPESLAEQPEGPTLKWLREEAKALDAAISGSIIVKDGEDYFNRLYFVLPDGQYYTYDKRHTFSFAGEDEHYSKGNSRLIVDYKGWRICPLICYDLRFPVWSRNTENYDFVFYIASWPAVRSYAWESLLIARAIENVAYCAGVNRVGTDANGHDYSGDSALYDMRGKQISESKEGAWVDTWELDKAVLNKFRQSFRALDDRDEFEVI